MRRLAVIASALVLLVGTACSQDSPAPADELPDADELLQASATTMAGLQSVGFFIEVDGELSSYQIQQARGTLTAEGDVDATAQLFISGRLTEAEFVRVDGTSYLKLATGGFRRLPAFIASQIFDASSLLAAQGGIPEALAAAVDATTIEESEPGIYRVTATIDPDLIEGLSLLVTGTADPATLLISEKDGRLLRAEIIFHDPSTEETTGLTVTFSDFDEDVDIQPPI